MARQHLLCPSCMQYSEHFVEPLDEGDVAWCQTCKRVHLIEEPDLVLNYKKKPLPRWND
jgi:hypothetical protein